jgi:hypothetical protein
MHIKGWFFYDIMYKRYTNTDANQHLQELVDTLLYILKWILQTWKNAGRINVCSHYTPLQIVYKLC